MKRSSFLCPPSSPEAPGYNSRRVLTAHALDSTYTRHRGHCVPPGGARDDPYPSHPRGPEDVGAPESAVLCAAGLAPYCRYGSCCDRIIDFTVNVNLH